MRKYNLTLAIAAILIMLAGCAGRDFVRPDSTGIRVGQSTYQQVIERMGNPRSTGEVQKNGETIKSVVYAYAQAGGEPLEKGVIPARATALFFHRDILVGQEFLSSFKSDHTNFDESLVSAIVKGKTKRSEVIELIGKPTASFIKPVVRETTGEAIGYTYHATSGNVLSGLKNFRKTLRITFDANDLVLDVEYTTLGNK